MGILLASWIGVDILSRVSRINLAVEESVSGVGPGLGLDAGEGREDGGVGSLPGTRPIPPTPAAVRASLSVCLVRNAALYGEEDSILCLRNEEPPPNITGPPYIS